MGSTSHGKSHGRPGFNRKRILSVGMALAAAAMAPVSAEATPAHRISVSIDQVRALDKLDELSRGDLFARITIAGETTTTDIKRPSGSRSAAIKPGWVITRDVAPGEHPVKVELIDKDVAEDDVIDINRLDNRRIIEFTVDTRRCRIDGFATTYRCGTRIVRAGQEKKAAEIQFRVDVTK